MDGGPGGVCGGAGGQMIRYEPCADDRMMCYAGGRGRGPSWYSKKTVVKHVEQFICTVAILAQGTSWAVAVTQAFLHWCQVPVASKVATDYS